MKCPQPNAAPLWGLPSLSLRSFNSGHTAPLRFAQIQPNGWTSHVRKTLSAIPCSKMPTVRGWQKKEEILNEAEVNN